MIALGVPDDQVAPLIPIAIGLVTLSGAVLLWARDKAKDAAGLRYNRVAETSQRSHIRTAVRTTTAAFAISLLPIAALLPRAASVAHAAIQAPRAYSTVKSAFLFVVLVAVIMSILAYAEMRRARRNRASWNHERRAVLND